MRPTRRAAAVAAAAVSRPLSPSPISSEEDEMDSSELEEMDTGDNEVFTEDEIEEDQPIVHDVMDNNDGMESLSEQEEDDDEQEIIQDEDDEEDDEDEDEDEDEEQVFTSRKPVARNTNKRKKQGMHIVKRVDRHVFI